MTMLYNIMLALSTALLCVTTAGSDALDRKAKTSLQKGDIFKEVRVEIQDGSIVSPRALLELVLLLGKCECSIQDIKCECCLKVAVLNKKPCCLKMQYNLQNSAVTGTVTVASKRLLRFEVAATTNSDVPACFNYKHSAAVEMCFNFFGIGWKSDSNEMRMCSSFKLSILKLKVWSNDFGCFEFGVNKAIANMAKTLNLVPDIVNFKVNSTHKNAVNKCFFAPKKGISDKSCRKVSYVL